MQAKIQTKEVTFKLLAVEKLPVARGRLEDVYTYVSTDNQFGIQFHAHPRRAFSYSILRTHNLSVAGRKNLTRNRAAIIQAFITQGLNQEALGGWDSAIKELNTELVVGVSLKNVGALKKMGVKKTKVVLNVDRLLAGLRNQGVIVKHEKGKERLDGAKTYRLTFPEGRKDASLLRAVMTAAGSWKTQGPGTFPLIDGDNKQYFMTAKAVVPETWDSQAMYDSAQRILFVMEEGNW
jgi:hypothetical protein